MVIQILHRIKNLFTLSALFSILLISGISNIYAQSERKSSPELLTILDQLRNFRSDPVNSLRLLERGFALLSPKDSVSYAALLHYSAELKLVYHKSDEAYKAAQASLQIYKSLKLYKDELRANILISRILLLKAEVQHAIEILLKSSKVAEKNNDSTALAESWNFLSVSYYMTGDLHYCLEFGQKAMFLFSELNDSLGLALSYEHLCYYYIALRDFESAIRMNSISLGIRTRFNDVVACCENYENLGVIYGLLNKIKEQQIAYAKILDLHKVYKDTVGLGSAYSGLGFLFFQQGDYKKALQYYFKSVENRKITKELRGSIITNLRIAQTYEKMGNTGKALEFFKIYDQLKDSMNSKSKQDLISEMTAKYNLESRDTKIKLLEKNEQLNETVRLFLILLSGILAILLLVIYFAYKHKKSVNQLLIKQNNEIKANKEELEKLYRERNKFFGIISHDLRSPFQTFLSHTELLAGGIDELDQSEIRRISKNLNTSAIRLYKLLDGLLEWANTISASAAKPFERVDISGLVDNLCQLYDDALSEKKISLTKNYAGPNHITTIKNNIESVIRNLLTNAIKFSYPGGNIEIAIQTVNSSLSLTVSDHGVGIDDDRLNDLVNGSGKSTSGTQNESGTGLGLLLCKELVKQCDGIMNIQSTLGKGTTVEIILPDKKI